MSHGCKQVFVVMLAQEFPEGESTVAQRLFSIGIASVGLIFFALILALTEQVAPGPPDVTLNVVLT